MARADDRPARMDPMPDRGALRTHVWALALIVLGAVLALVGLALGALFNRP